MNLERFIAALGPDEVVHGAVGRRPRSTIRDLAYDTRTVHARRALLLRARAERRRARVRAGRGGRGAAALVVERAARRSSCRSSSSPTSARRCRVAADALLRRPVEELDVAAVTGTNGKTTTAFLLHAILEAAGRPTGPAHEHRAPRRRRAAADRPQHARGDRPPAPPPRDGRRRRSRVRARGDLGGGGAGPARADALRRARLHEPDPGPPQLPRHDGGVLRRRRRRSSPRPSAPSSTSATSGGGGSRATLPDAVTFDAGSDDARRDRPAPPRRASTARTRSAPRSPRARSASSDDAIRAGSSRVAGVPGRFEAIDEGQPFTVIVDYAHTPDSLENVDRRRARPRRRPAHRRVRRRRRPRPRQAAR